MNSSLMLAAACAVCLPAVSSADDVRPQWIEFNGDNGRRDVLTRGWTDWRIANGSVASGTCGAALILTRVFHLQKGCAR